MRFTIITIAVFAWLVTCIVLSIPGIARAADIADLEVPGAASGKCVEGDCFQNATRIDGNFVPLRGAGLFRVLNQDLYTSAFYVSPDAKTNEDVLGDVPKRLVIHCRRDFQKEDMMKATEKYLAANPDVDMKKLEACIEKLSTHCGSVKQGDEYSMTYVPGKGTYFQVNGELKTVIQGPDFARAYFGIWLSPYSISQKLRLQLLSSAVV